MKRTLFTLAATVSLLLCLATVGLWVRSYWSIDRVVYTQQHLFKALFIHSVLGEIAIGTGAEPSLLPPLPPVTRWKYETESTGTANLIWVWKSDVPANLRSRTFWVFTFISGSDATVPISFRMVGLPHWFLALLFAILPAGWLLSTLRTRHRNRVGHCPTCGYDLRATPHRCPECGAVAGGLRDR